MAVSLRTEVWPEAQSDVDAITQLQTVLLRACEGNRDDALNVSYRALRRALLRHPRFNDIVPSPVRTSHDLGRFWTYIKGYDPQWEPRRAHVREFMQELLDRAEAQEMEGGGRSPLSSSSWTGITSGRERARAVQLLAPLAVQSVETLISHYEKMGSNGGPPLEDRAELINNLKGLHGALGELLRATEEEDGFDARGEGMVVEVARYASRAARAVKSDPLPYAVSGLVIAICSAFGPNAMTGWLAGIALQMKRNKDG